MSGGRVLYLDAFAGLAGDMLVASLIHLGADLEAIRAGLEKLPVRGYALRATPVTRGPFAATHFQVDPVRDAEPLPLDEPEAHDHSHEHGHSHSHSHGLLRVAWPGQPDRSWRGIRAMISSAPLPSRVVARALAVFQRLAEAEARVHGFAVEDAHFHEVGAVDSIVDIVGAALALELLGVDRVVASPLPMGQGLITTEHGRIPLPAPATVEVLRGWPVVEARAGREHVTPTGAALVAALAEPGSFPSMEILGVGYGAGTRDPPDLPNVLRAVLGRDTAADSPERVAVIEAQMDDLPGEHWPPLLDALFAAGALDAFAVPVLMKKGRPGLWVHALAEPHAAPEVERALLRHGSTFGCRRSLASRRVLRRRHETVETPWGPIRVKLGSLDGALLHAMPEHEDVARLAASAGLPVPQVYAAAQAAWAAREGEQG